MHNTSPYYGSKMKRLNKFLNILMGAFVGVFLGRCIYVCWDYAAHPELYAMQSAPWYTSILVYGIFTAFVLLLGCVIKFFIKRYLIKKKTGENR